MKIVVFGPTGMVGSRIVAELEQRGHEVVGASRSGGTDVTDPDSVASAAAGADAVVCAVSARGVEYTLADVARSLLDGVRRAGARRVVSVGGTGSLEVAPGVRYVDTPGSTSRLPVPPTATTRFAPARRTPSTSDRATSASV